MTCGKQWKGGLKGNQCEGLSSINNPVCDFTRGTVNIAIVAGEMAHRLGALVALLEGLVSIPRTPHHGSLLSITLLQIWALTASGTNMLQICIC